MQIIEIYFKSTSKTEKNSDFYEGGKKIIGSKYILDYGQDLVSLSLFCRKSLDCLHSRNMPETRKIWVNFGLMST